MGSEGARFGVQGDPGLRVGGDVRDVQPRRVERRNAVIVSSYAAGESLASIGLRVGLTRERVRQIVKASGAVMPSELRCGVAGCDQTPRAPNTYCHSHRTRLRRDAATATPLLKDAHGTYASYRDRRCRCDLCRKASADRRRAQFHRVHPEWKYRASPRPPA